MNINNLTLDELYALNKKVVARIKELRSEEDRKIANDLSLGDIVSFKNKSGITERGVVIKVNKKTAKVKAESITWTISLSLLKKEMSIEQIKTLRDQLLKDQIESLKEELSS